MRPNRAFIALVFFLVFLAAVPVVTAVRIRSSVYSLLKGPVWVSKGIAQLAYDLFHFERNAAENRTLRKTAAQAANVAFYKEEVFRENERLRKLLALKQAVPPTVHETVFARVIGRSPSTWNRVFLLDRGRREGVRLNMLVLSDLALVGKIIEVGPSVSKALLVTDPSSRIGVLVQRTRSEGILYGVLSGGCRMKYIPPDARLKPGDVIETAGFGGFFPKGLVVGSITRVWKEPGQVYQVADVEPRADLNRLEEVTCVN